MLDIEMFHVKQSYVTLAQTKSVAFGFVQSLTASKNDIDKLQLIRSIEKANRIVF